MLLQESRQETRRPPGREAVCRLLLEVGGVVSPALIQNVCVSGIGLVLHRQFELGTVLTVELINPGKNFSHRGRVRVVHAGRQDREHWLVGFSFLTKLNAEELAALV